MKLGATTVVNTGEEGFESSIKGKLDLIIVCSLFFIKKLANLIVTTEHCRRCRSYSSSGTLHYSQSWRPLHHGWLT